MQMKNKKFQTRKSLKDNHSGNDSFKKGKFSKKRSLEQDSSSPSDHVAKKGKFNKNKLADKKSPKKGFTKKTNNKFKKQKEIISEPSDEEEEDDEEIPTLVPIESEDDEEIPTLVPIESEDDEEILTESDDDEEEEIPVAVKEPAKVSKKALKNKFKNKALQEKAAEVELPPAVRNSEDPLPKKKVQWINKNRVLVFASRGINQTDRHLMQNLRALMPHSKTESKKDKKDPIYAINEISEMKNCQRCIFFERKRNRLYMWMSNIDGGPSVEFLVSNVHTMQDKKFTGNCLKGSRPMLAFDKVFDTRPEFMLIKQLFIHTFGVPQGHPKSQPFFDHIYGFKVLNNHIWFQNCQVTDTKTGDLSEIGPRMTLQVVKILKGSFNGEVIYKNKEFNNITTERRINREKLEKKKTGKVNSDEEEEEEDDSDDMSVYEEED